jgi:hypothetical protein
MMIQRNRETDHGPGTLMEVVTLEGSIRGKSNGKVS